MAAGPNHPMGMDPAHSSSPSSGKDSKGSKASKGIVLGGVAVVTLLLIGYCSAQNDDYDEVNAECVDLDSRQPDGSYTVVDEDYCDDDGGSHYHGSHGAYGWYYGGARSGARILHGTTVRPADVRITSRQGTVIQRGGFGFRGRSGS
ncbi:hypothetical protein ACFYSC_23590 [Streptosporangium sp. NPDC004379]|uniref:hypothetical protein n=1 Tax=Streptosporangium sp. NPDC004379 TaxID=3366189 RepID=UPI0036B1586D